MLMRINFVEATVQPSLFSDRRQAMCAAADPSNG